jgi:endoribonuclease Dicer
VLRENSVCNRYLLGRGHVLNLASYTTVEPNNQAKWRWIAEPNTQSDGDWYVKRKIPRRSVQDCMEAMIAVGFLSGGVETALTIGTELGLCFGGPTAWWERYSSDEMDISSGSAFPALEAALGYTFKNKRLLREALTHPTFHGDSPSYQRLEYLGDGTCNYRLIGRF